MTDTLDTERLEYFRHSLRQVKWSLTTDWNRMSTAERVHSWPKVVAAFEGWLAMLQAFEAEVREAEPGIAGFERDRS